MATAKKYAEFELPPKLIEAMTKAIGPTRLAKTTSDTRSKIQSLAGRTAAELGRILEEDENYIGERLGVLENEQ